MAAREKIGKEKEEEKDYLNNKPWMRIRHFFSTDPAWKKMLIRILGYGSQIKIGKILISVQWFE